MESATVQEDSENDENSPVEIKDRSAASMFGDYGEAMDRQAFNSIKQELIRLKEKREDQLERGNLEGAMETLEEMEQITSHLKGAQGLGSQPRRIGGVMKKIQSGISMSLKRAKDTIGEHLPDLKEYLSRRISGKGGYAYIPDPDHALEWNFGES